MKTAFDTIPQGRLSLKKLIAMNEELTEMLKAQDSQRFFQVGHRNAYYVLDDKYGINVSGMEILDIMPEVPQEAIDAARALIKRTECENQCTIETLLEKAKKCPDKCADRECNPKYFGHYLGLESVCNTREAGIKVPYFEFSYFNFSDEICPISESI